MKKNKNHKFLEISIVTLFTIFFSFLVSQNALAKDKWNNFKIKNCPHNLSFKSGTEIPRAFYDQELIKGLERNPNRKMSIGWAHSVLNKKNNRRLYCTYFSTLGSLMKVQGQITKLNFNKMANWYENNSTELNFEKGTKLRRYADKLLSHLPNEVKKNYNYGSIKTKIYFSTKNKIVVLAKQEKVKIINQYVSGWSIAQMHYVSGCVVNMNSFFSDTIFNEEEVISFAYDTIVKISEQ